jgi:hypothetical protein
MKQGTGAAGQFNERRIFLLVIFLWIAFLLVTNGFVGF